MPIPITYRKSGEGAIATYDYIDLGEGTGIVKLYGAETQSGKIAIRNAIHSNTIFSGAAIATAEGTVDWDQDFDVTFNMPQVIKGRFIANIPMNLAQGANCTKHMKAIITIKKVDGTTAAVSTLATGTSDTWTYVTVASGGKDSTMGCVEIDIPQTKFKRNDTLRLQIQISAWSTAGASANYFVGYDPAGRAGTFDDTDASSIMSFYVPFKIDL